MNTDTLEHFKRLKFEQENYLKVCNENILKWEKFQQDYKTLKARLESLPNELKHDVMVPISSKAFKPGKIIHTNEILVLLGDNWFVEKSAKQACELISRRLINIDKHLEDLGKEKNIILDQTKWTSDLMKEKGEYVNIEEKLDGNEVNKLSLMNKKQATMSEEDKKLLRKKQQEKALQFQKKIDDSLKEAHQNLHKPSQDRDESSVDEEDEEEKEDEFKAKISNANQLNFDDMFSNLNIRESTVGHDQVDHPNENNTEEFDKMIREYEANINRKNNELIHQALEKKSQSIKALKGSATSTEKLAKKSVKWSDVTDVDRDDNDEEEEVNESDEEEDEDFDSDDDLVEEEIKQNQPMPTNIIRIRHTKEDELSEKERNLKISRAKQELNSPGDIFTLFHKPKSILKVGFSSSSNISLNDDYDKENDVSNAKTTKIEPKNAEDGKFEPEKAFSGEIIEKLSNQNSDKPTSSNESESSAPKKKLSKFKASKQN